MAATNILDRQNNPDDRVDAVNARYIDGKVVTELARFQSIAVTGGFIAARCRQRDPVIEEWSGEHGASGGGRDMRDGDITGLLPPSAVGPFVDECSRHPIAEPEGGFAANGEDVGLAVIDGREAFDVRISRSVLEVAINRRLHVSHADVDRRGALVEADARAGVDRANLRPEQRLRHDVRVLAVDLGE